MIETLGLQEAFEMLEMLLGFPRESHDQGRAQHGIRQLLANAVQQPLVHIRLPGAVHRPQHLGVTVLQWQVEIGHHVRHVPVRGEHLRCEACGIGVMHPDPGDLHLSESPQQLRQFGFSVEIESVIGGDLTDQDQFLHPLIRQLMGFRHDGFDRTAALITPQLGNDAEGAAVVAALRHLEEGHRLIGGALSRQMLIPHEGGHGAHLIHPFAGFHPFQHIHDVLIVPGAHDGFGLRDRLQQLLLEMLGQAAGNDQFLALLRQAHQGAHRFFAGILNEAAGVHHHHRGIVLIGADAVTGFGQQSHHVFGVHTVLFAAQMGKGDRRSG